MNELILISSCIAPSRAFSRGLSNYSFSIWIATYFRPWDQAHSYNSPWRPLEGSTPWTEHLCWLWTFDCVSRLTFWAFYTEININMYFPFQEIFYGPLINSALIKSTPNLLNYQNKISVLYSGTQTHKTFFSNFNVMWFVRQSRSPGRICLNLVYIMSHFLFGLCS